jgi:hypothetical protein
VNQTIPIHPADGHEAPQRVVKVRRDYNSWVAHETMEDYALRYTPQRFRKWSTFRVANTAFGAASFLILEAVGATLLVQYGFINAFWAILATGLIIFLAGLPISIYAARYGVDMDLLTRGAGFGYIGSTLTSLIYASFTFIFFALEAAVMAYALDLALGIPPLGLPGVRAGGDPAGDARRVRHQPAAGLDPADLAGDAGGAFRLRDDARSRCVQRASCTTPGRNRSPAASNCTCLVPPPRWASPSSRRWASRPTTCASCRRAHRRQPRALVAGRAGRGPGLGDPGRGQDAGRRAAGLPGHPAHGAGGPRGRSQPDVPGGYEYVFPHYGWAVAATALFVVISQLKINVTNAYAGSLAWSNFFSRVTHSHPGRVVWVVFNTLIAFMLMEMNVFQALGDVLGLYSNIAIAWMMAVVADLVVNKPLGLSPRGIEFKRAYLYDINPVGVGAMALASVLSITAYLGVFGPVPRRRSRR